MTGPTAPDASIEPPSPVVAGSIGLMGGTFDPIHHGHLAIAEEAREVLGLAVVRFVPAAASPFKTDRIVTPAEHRMAMVEAAVAGHPQFEASRMEVDRPAPSYTIDTLARIAAEARGPVWMVVSSESLAGFPRWREPGRILELAHVAVVPRAGVEPLGPAWVAAHFPGRESRVRFLPGPLLPISGSVVRRRVAAGRSVRYLVPDAVARYIADHHLYRDPA